MAAGSSTLALVLWGGLACFLLCALGLWALIKLPGPVPYRWEVRLFLLMGMPADQFLAFIIKNGVDPVFWHRALYGAYVSIMNALFWIPKEEQAVPPEAVDKVEIKHPPLFIVGHYRSGTSLLHELLDRDENLLAPTAFQCYTPRIFLGREDFMSKKFSDIKMERPMDAMKVGINSPFEDEFAIANLSGLSPYMGAIFPRQYHFYERYLAFREGDVTPAELAAWKRTIVWFFKKVLFRHQDKRLILKSPSHTARVRILRELFPGAKFIHISRNPYEIYQSTHKLHEKLLIQWCLQRPPYENKEWIKGNIISHFRRMYDAYFQDVRLLGPDELMDIRYADLIASPVKTIEGIYTHFRLPGFEAVRPTLTQYEREQKSFTVNKHSSLPEAEKALVQEAWGDYFEFYGYEK